MSLRKRLLIAAVSLGLLLLAAALPALAQPFRVYVVTWRGITNAEEGFVSYFRERGTPVEFIFRDADRDLAQLDEILDEIRRERPHLVYAFGTTVATHLAGTQDYQDPERHLTDIPVVFNIVADPAGARIATDLSGTGRNVTGTSHLVPVETQFNALQAIGNYHTVGAIYNPLEANSALAISQLTVLMERAGMRLVSVPVAVVDGAPSIEAVPAAVDALADAGVQIVYLPSDSFIISNAGLVVDEIHRRGIPTFSATEAPIREAGALIGIVSNYFTVGRFAGFKAEQILVGRVDPGRIPIETLARFTFLVNLRTMRELKHYPPMNVLQFAEVVDRPLEAAAVTLPN